MAWSKSVGGRAEELLERLNTLEISISAELGNLEDEADSLAESLTKTEALVAQIKGMKPLVYQGEHVGGQVYNPYEYVLKGGNTYFALRQTAATPPDPSWGALGLAPQGLGVFEGVKGRVTEFKLSEAGELNAAASNHFIVTVDADRSLAVTGLSTEFLHSFSVMYRFAVGKSFVPRLAATWRPGSQPPTWPINADSFALVYYTAYKGRLSARLVAQGGTPTPTPNPTAPTMSVSPHTVATIVGSGPTTITAAVTNSTAVVTWTLTGPGTLSATTGNQITYTPPASATSGTTATVKATLGTTGVSDTVDVSVQVLSSTGGTGGGGTGGGGTGTRGPFQIKEGFTASQLPANAQDLWAATSKFTRFVAQKKLADVAQGSSLSPGGNKVDIYGLRSVHAHFHNLAMILDATGDPAALNGILDMWDVLNRKAETRWYPGFRDYLAPLEMRGIKRFNYYNTERKTFDKFLSEGGYTNHHDLESDLHSGYCGELRYVLWQNRDASARAERAYLEVCDYHDGISAQRELFSKAEYPSKPRYWWGKPLHHPTGARHAEAFYMALMGHSSWQPALDQFRTWLRNDMELLDHPRGYKLYNTPHGVQGRYGSQGASLPKHDASQDCTYIGEEWPLLEMQCRAGSDFYTPAVMEAIGHTCDQGVFYDGYGVKTYLTKDSKGNPVGTYTVGGSIAGGGLSSVQRVFATRSGSKIGSRWKIPGNNKREEIHQIQRNLTTAPLWRIMTPEIDDGLAKVSQQTTSTERKAADLTRFLGRIGGRID